MPITYSESKTSLDEIAARIARNRSRIGQARSLLTTARSDTGAMPADYGGVATDINAAAAANPGNEAWQMALAEKNLLVADFQALKTELDALVTALGA